MKTKADFGRFLADARVDAGVTQAEVAEGLGLASAQFVSNVERGLCLPPVKHIRPWSKLIKVNPERMVDNILLVERARILTVLRSNR